MSLISLNLLGDMRQIPVEELPAVTSRHTGRQLRRVNLELRVSGDRHEQLEAELRAASTPDGDPLEGEDARWLVSGNRYSYTHGAEPQVYTHHLELQEAEQLEATAVEVGDLVLIPTHYKERADPEEPLVLTFVVQVTEGAVQRLEEMLVARGDEGYFSVIRRGVSDTPIQMRFGQCLWEEVRPGVRRHDLTLVADKDAPIEKVSGFARINQPQLDRTTEATVATTRALALLVEELRAQGVLSDEASARVSEALVPHELTSSEQRAFSKTYDLDAYLD